MIYVNEFTGRFKRYPIFSFNDARLLMNDKEKVSESYVKRFIYLMLKRGRILRVTKGYYTFNRDIMVAGLAFKPYYYGLGYALTYHNIWEQQANPTIITTKHVAQGVRTVFGMNVILRRIPKKYFFGFISTPVESYRSYSIYISDPEKTLIDIVYYRNKYAEYVLRNLVRKIDSARLRKYLAGYDARVKKRVTLIFNRYKRKS